MTIPGEPIYCEVCGQRVPEEGEHVCPPSRVKDFQTKYRPLRPLECELRLSNYLGGGHVSKTYFTLWNRDDS